MQQPRTFRTCLAFLRLFPIAIHTLAALTFGQSFRLTTTHDFETRLPFVRVDGTAGTSGTLEVSSKISGGSWSTLANFTMTGTAYNFLDRAASGAGPRFYRVRAAGSPVATLPDLALSPNAVFTPAEGFDTVQYAPNGALGFIFWRNRDLVLRERAFGAWSEQTIASDGNLFDPAGTLQYRNFQPAAVLVYDSNSRAHVFRLSGSTLAHYTRGGTAWTRSENLTPANAGLMTKLLASAGPNNALHVGVLGASGNIVYGSTKNGSWQWSTVTTVGADPYWTPGSYSRRWFSMAVDSRNAAHFVYRPAFTMGSPGGYPLAYTQLWYASNRSGSWAVSLVRQPDDNSGEVGSGMSIAIGADDLPAIASWYNERGTGGSSQWSRLQYYKMNSSGGWTRGEVISRPDAYLAGDGEKGTGAQPYLRFDYQGRPHILFLDHASEHFPFQNEYAGHLRHSWWNGSAWITESILRQDRPLQQQILFSAFAMNGNEMTVTALERLTQWNVTVNPQIASSTYRFSVITRSMQ